MLRELDVARKYHELGGLPLVVAGMYFRLRNLTGIFPLGTVPDEISINQNGQEYTIPVTDEDELEKWLQYERNVVQPEVKRPMRELLKSGDTFLDIGAYNGDTSVYAHSLVGDSGRVIAFDPDPKPLETLRTTVKRNALENVTVENYAVGDTSGQIQASEVLGQTREEFVADKSNLMKIESVRIDDYVAELGIEPDLLKIDVDGAELSALRGSKDVIGRYPIILELHHDELLDEWEETVEFILDRADAVYYLGAQGLEPNAHRYHTALSTRQEFDRATVTNLLLV